MRPESGLVNHSMRSYTAVLSVAAFCKAVSPMLVPGTVAALKSCSMDLDPQGHGSTAIVAPIP